MKPRRATSQEQVKALEDWLGTLAWDLEQCREEVERL